MPLFLIFSILFALWVRYEIRKTSKTEEESNAGFIEREQRANFVRKADISALDYIRVPLDSLPFSGDFAEVKASYSLPSSISEAVRAEIMSCEKAVISISNKKILNLGGISNTDIKFQYGAANLPVLMQYDENFAKLSRTLAKWARLLFEEDEFDAAEKILTFSVACKSDIEEVFIMLAKIYRKNGNELGISGLVSACDCFDEFRRQNIIDNITSI